MKLHYHPETDSLYIELKTAQGAEPAKWSRASTSTLTPRATS